ncbi:helix-turn-helix transcriptional regulator [candidate division WOR-3 bacterium]|nr:helix-turn-helix transcriptional regulator [candidate division WOR-3 bacterium]
MTERAEWFRRLGEKLEQDPVYWTEYLKLEFAEELSRLMDESGLTKTDLATKLGCSRAYITKVFNTTFNPTLETLAKIALVFDARVELKLVPRNAPSGNRVAAVPSTHRRERRHELASPLLAQSVAADRPARVQRNDFIARDRPFTKPARPKSRRRQASGQRRSPNPQT